MLDGVPLHEVDEGLLRAMLDADIQESRTLDYKRDLKIASNPEKSEFARDVAAFTNTQGGHLVFGIDDNPTPPALVGIEIENVDDCIIHLTNIARDRIEPKIFGLEMYAVPVLINRYVLIVRVPASRARPHMTKGKDSRYFDERGVRNKEPMEIATIRDQFMGGEVQAERIRVFREKRLRILNGEESTLKAPDVPRLDGEGRLFIHVVPLGTFGQRNAIPIDEMRRKFETWLPSQPHWIKDSPSRRDDEATSVLEKPNLEGLLVMRSLLRDSWTETNQILCSETVQVFRDGVVEIGAGGLKHEGRQTFNLRKLDGRILLTLNPVITRLGEAGFSGEFAVFVSLCGLYGSKPTGIEDHIHAMDRRPTHPVDRHELLLSEVVVEAPDCLNDWQHAMRPLLDVLWQALGFARCERFDEDGRWINNP